MKKAHEGNNAAEKKNAKEWENEDDNDTSTEGRKMRKKGRKGTEERCKAMVNKENGEVILSIIILIILIVRGEVILSIIILIILIILIVKITFIIVIRGRK